MDRDEILRDLLTNTVHALPEETHEGFLRILPDFLMGLISSAEMQNQLWKSQEVNWGFYEVIRKTNKVVRFILNNDPYGYKAYIQSMGNYPTYPQYKDAVVNYLTRKYPEMLDEQTNYGI